MLKIILDFIFDHIWMSRRAKEASLMYEMRNNIEKALGLYRSELNDLNRLFNSFYSVLSQQERIRFDRYISQCINYANSVERLLMYKPYTISTSIRGNLYFNPSHIDYYSVARILTNKINELRQQKESFVKLVQSKGGRIISYPSSTSQPPANTANTYTYTNYHIGKYTQDKK